MSIWVEDRKGGDFVEMGRRFGIDPAIARIIRNRGAKTEEEYDLYLNGTLDNLYDGRSMLDMVKACCLIQQYISENKKIRIIGDYDVDGVCSTYILVKGLQACGADVDYAIPHRITDGYGLNKNLVKKAYEDGREIIVTCDNGIAAAEQIAYANELGMHVIVTDHHEIPFEVVNEETDEREELLPPAEAVVDPHRYGDNYPFPNICGAVVAWKLIGILLEMCGIADQENIMLELLEEAAIATVGDVMELQDENRIIVSEGLRRLQYTDNEGLKALILATGLNGKNITAYHIGFVIGPCINATGRLDSAARAIELLLCQNEFDAARMAEELKELNDARKDMTEQGLELAVDDIENSELGLDRVLVVYLPGIHESIAGIIAGRLRERYEKPSIVMTDACEDTPMIKGSGRSIEAYNMFEELSKHKELYTKFGGHKMAAGLSMPLDNLEEFRSRLNSSCSLTDEDLVTKVHFDALLPTSYITETFISQLELLEPFGNGNTKPNFVIGNVKVLGARNVGKNNVLTILKVRDEQAREFEMKMFYKADEYSSKLDEQYGNGTASDLFRGRSSKDIMMNVMYYPGINEYRGNRSIEFIINDYKLK